MSTCTQAHMLVVGVRETFIKRNQHVSYNKLIHFISYTLFQPPKQKSHTPTKPKPSNKEIQFPELLSWCLYLTLIVSLVSVFNAKVIALDIQVHIRKDEFLFDQFPDDPIEEYSHVNMGHNRKLYQGQGCVGHVTGYAGYASRKFERKVSTVSRRI